jgi:hypothetical protein
MQNPDRDYDSRPKATVHHLPTDRTPTDQEPTAQRPKELHATNQQLYRLNELGMLRNGLPITRKEANYLLGRAKGEGKW